MFIKIRPGLAIVGLVLAAPSSAYSLSDNIEIEPTARYRFQDVDDPVRGNAQASTLKLRLTADWKINNAWTVGGQYDYVTAFNEDSYNSVTVNRATSPIPDPAGQELNQLFVQYQSHNNWSLKLGRQAVAFDNERHIGTVEFWQNDQTLDGFRFEYKDHLSWTANYLYVDKAQRIFGNHAKARLSAEDSRFAEDPIRPTTELGVHHHDSHLLNLEHRFNDNISLSAYAYLLENLSRAQFSSNTYGVRFSGEFKPDNIKYGYALEFANQSAAHNSPWQYTANYLLLEASAQYKSHRLTLNYESMGEDSGFGFATSLGTNHKFQGWADLFTDYVSRGGLVDINASYRGRDGKLRWRVVAHQFQNYNNNDTVGHELDIEVAYRYTRKWEFKVIGAKYFADQGLATLPETQQDLSTWMISAAYNF